MGIYKRIIVMLFILILFCPAASKAEDNKSNIVYNENILVDCGCIVADNSGNIYLVNGLFGTIQVYNQQGVYLYSIPVNSNGGSFTISKDNNYLYVAVVRRGTVLTYDNKGYLIDERSDEYASAFKRFREENSQRFISSNGDVYSIVNFLGYIAVSKNTGDSVIKIYNMPIFHWIIKFLVSIVFLFGMSFAPVLVFSNKLKKKDKKLEGKLRFIDFYLYIIKIKKILDIQKIIWLKEKL